MSMYEYEHLLAHTTTSTIMATTPTTPLPLLTKLVLSQYRFLDVVVYKVPYVLDGLHKHAFLRVFTTLPQEDGSAIRTNLAAVH